MQSNHQYSGATPLNAEHRPLGGSAWCFFHTNLPVQVNKQKDHPTYLRQLTLEIINDIPVDAVKVYTEVDSSHVNIQGNKITDALAKAGADDASVPSAPLTYLELFSRAKSRNKTIWLIPPVHHWYQGSRPGGCLSIDCNRRDQTTLTRFLSGHIRSLTKMYCRTAHT
ncbi:hypothetical protein AVEN_53433-1 [Araneus ventricosus]|uniref:RNase H type-1 domain-containing protein n=1 Tax=Araneus ventricosus TaxID=182803 RepID=A0A4Y2AB01_ARAVE|nr:hypothetical protein AVEN_53433-1 [Araneus ventricosus]